MSHPPISAAGPMPDEAGLLRSLRLGLQGADAWASALQAQGHRVVRTLGLGLPLPRMRACGLRAVALQPVPAAAGAEPSAEGLRPEDAWAAALQRSEPWPLLIRTDEPQHYAVFSIVRERMRTGDLPSRPLFGLDLPGGEGDAARAYRSRQLAHFAAWAESIGGHQADGAALAHALALEQQRGEMLDRLDACRSGARPTLCARDWLCALLSSAVFPVEPHIQALELLCEQAAQAASIRGVRSFVAGLHADALDAMDGFDQLGLAVVGDDLRWLAPERREATSSASTASDPFTLALYGPLCARLIDPIERATRTVQQAQRVGAQRLVHLARAGDERESWFRHWLQLECQRVGLPFVAQDGPSEAAAVAASAAPEQSKPSAPRAAPADGRSRKSLGVVAEFSAYQREWFQTIRRRAAEGEPFAVVNADAPQELLRAFDVPFVVNQWWASIVAAKQQSARYLQLLSERAYPTDAEPYSAQGLAALFDDDEAQAPWGGLPKPGLLLAVNGTPATAGIFASWAADSGAELLMFDRSAETRVDLPVDWWEQLPHHWDTWLQAERLDLLEAQFGLAIERIQTVTGRRFDEARFREVMDLVNRQEEHYRQARDLIAAAAQAPVSVVDTMPAIMVPQWHRGTAWGAEAARRFYEEVRLRVEGGQAACAGERLRLMWVGRGLWSRMAFYQQWEESHGAVFVWAMYQGLAADGYLRYVAPGQSALRALASRFVTMGDELRMPTWAGAWHVKEARLHRVHAAVAVDDADPLVLQALERAGYPVLRLNLSNFGALDAALAQAAARVGPFLDRLHAGKAHS